MARKFFFALTPLLELRLRNEAQKRRQLATCRQAVAECERTLEKFASARTGAKTSTDLRLRDAYLCGLDRALERERLNLRDRQVEWVLARNELIAARRDRGVLERLRDRRRQAFDARERRLEEREIDEANAQARGRPIR
jgi:flagellar export protein FliJ